MNNQCIMCGNVIPEGRQVCSICENTVAKIGVILQSQNATDEVAYEAHKKLQKKNKKTISLDDGKYVIVYDESNSYPEKVFRYGEGWKNVVGDNLIFWLCAEIERLRELVGEA